MNKKVYNLIEKIGIVNVSDTGKLSYLSEPVGEIGECSVILRYKLAKKDTQTLGATLSLRKVLVREGIPLSDEPPLHQLYSDLAHERRVWENLEIEVNRAALEEIRSLALGSKR